ncbi:hypothetical protein [Roseateles violae]|uniref:Uncharacterized protein n=1 Tax=Roseateles violae TaxID=3058042 RepID=A0ABT8E0E8_9BURK|nr:hypothetical protein [Pelomonas sp. PFR6]MDN3923274.1 hypothetical protein [Pelomonas sp. PFR6]
MTTPLARRAGEAPDSQAVAQALVGVWADIEDALHPVIGQRGLTALFRRCAHLGVADFPFLAALDSGAPDQVDRGEILALFGGLPPAQALDAGSLLLLSFRELLSTLIGPGLTERLLQSVWSPPSSGSSAQDKPS